MTGAGRIPATATRTAVVTGGAASIGQAFARRLAQDGHRVAIADLAAADETVAMANDAGSEALAARCDVSSGESVRAFAGAVAERFGHCDILVASAGIYPIAPLADTTWEQWRRVMSINLDSLFHLTQAFLPGMRERGWGRIIAVASNLFYTGMADMVPYVTSKGGVVGFVRALAGEVGEDGVTVNAIAPSLVRTQGTLAGPHTEMGLFEIVRGQQAIKRTQVPDDLTGTVSFLASDDAAFITGQTFPVDGGSVRV
jgi:NAD(P)-dependent dehydrogenase (short-subunit alcohol dehydrogenase family)